MLNTQRIVIMYIMIGLMCAIGISIYQGEDYNINSLTSFTDQGYNNTKQVESTDAIQPNPRTDIVTDAADAVLALYKWLKAAIWFFYLALWPLSFLNPASFTNTLEHMFAVAITVLRTFMAFIIIIEIVSYWRNKKQP